MKRIITFGLAVGFIILTFGGIGEIEPRPVEIKPVLTKNSTWSMYGKPIAYYQRVKLSDGSTLELKSRTPLTAKQWQDKSDDYQKAIDAHVEPEICPTCGGTGQI